MIRLALLIAALAVAACAPPTRPSEEVAAPNAGEVVHATGGFSITLPLGVRKVPVQGIDSAVDQFEGPNYTIQTDYGMYSCGPEERETAIIDARNATIVRYRDVDNAERPVQLTVRFNGLEQTGQQPLCLAAHAQCADDAACDAARAIINTIDFD